jgi:glycosyltransferase involved in cell wall biosynthesis
MKIGWMHYRMPKEDPVARGFFTVAYHLYEGLKATSNIEVIDLGPTNAYKKHIRRLGLSCIFHFAPPHAFKPVTWAVNHLYTMWEAPVLNPDLIPILQNVNGHLFVPSQFNRATFLKEAGVQAVAVPLGVSRAYMDTNGDRNLMVGPGTGRKRILFVGAPNPRKGYHFLPAAFRLALNGRQNEAQIYIKTMAAKGEPQAEQRPYNDDRMIFDTRDLSIPEMARLYESADVFIFPSLGEGFGLPPLEAMASGCLVVSTRAGGLAEFITHTTAVVIALDKKVPMRYGAEWEAKAPSIESIAFSLKFALDRWGTPGAEAIRRHGIRTARGYHWEKTLALIMSVIIGQPVAIPKELVHEENQILGVSV